MNRDNLLNLRTNLYNDYVERVKLGEFDANSKVILSILHALVELTTHLAEEQKKSKNANK